MPREKKPDGQIGVTVLNSNDRRQRIGCVDRVDLGDALFRFGDEFWVFQRKPSKLHIFGRERGTVRPGHVGPELERDVHPLAVTRKHDTAIRR